MHPAPLFLDIPGDSCYNNHYCGGVSEWFKEAVLKTVELLAGSVGSNPTLSVKNFFEKPKKTLDNYFVSCYTNEVGTRRDGREAEGAPLLREYAGNTASWVQIPLSPFFICASSSVG